MVLAAALRARRRAGARGALVRARGGEQALRANDLGAAIERAELGIDERRDRRGGGPAAPDPGRGARLARRAGRGAERGRWRQRRRSRPGSAALAARAGRRRSSRPPSTDGWTSSREQVGLVGETPCAPDATARNAQVICLSWAANYLVFGGRNEAADALILRIARAGG